MRIALLIPPSPFLMDQKVFLSLGILKVATSLEGAGHSVDVLDLSGVTNYEDVITDYIDANPEVSTYGVTATSPQMPAAVKILSLLEEANKKSILGGPHATLIHAAAKKSERAMWALCRLRMLADVVVAGDGEQAIHVALQQDKGIVDADNPGNGLFLTNKMFADSGWPARHLIDMDSYHYHIDGERATSIISQLGCPFHCTFCAGRNSPMLRRTRVRPPADAVAEIVHIYQTYGLKGVMYFDDELNVSKGMLEMLRGLKSEAERLGVQWKLRGFLKAELFNEEQAEAMYQAGFRQILVGFEAAHPRILANIQKNATVEDNTRAVQIAHKHGLKVKALMSVGHPGESEETITAVRDWLLLMQPSDFDVTVITPYPGSPYYDEAKPDGSHYTYRAKTGDRLYMDDVDFTSEAQYYKGAPGEYISHVWTDHITRKKLVEMRDWVEWDVRHRLKIPAYQTGTAIMYEHTYGASLPNHILHRKELTQ